MRSLFLLLFAASIAGATGDPVRIKLDDKALCVPRSRILHNTLPWLESIEGADTYPETKLLIANQQVIVTSERRVSGRSQAQQRLLDMIGSHEAHFEPLPNTKFYRAQLYPEFEFMGWEVVRWLPRGGEGSSFASLAGWIVAGCSETELGGVSCQVQRIHSGFAYEFWYSDDLAKIDNVTAMIENELERWQAACGKEA